MVAVHTRVASPAARRRVLEVVRRFEPRGWVLLEGRRVTELRPRGLPTKGDAVRWIAASRPTARILYVGDDVTDEDAFRALRHTDFAVVVDPVHARAESRSRRPTRAAFRLDSPEAVHDLLAVLAADGAAADGERSTPLLRDRDRITRAHAIVQPLRRRRGNPDAAVRRWPARHDALVEADVGAG